MSEETRGPLWLLPVVYYLLFLLILVGYWFIYTVNPAVHATWLRGEDHLIEWLTFISFFMAFVFMAFVLQFHRKMNTWEIAYFSGITLFCFICAGEEISWAQRVIGFETPESMLEVNEQQEFNLHNINFEHLRPQTLVAICLDLMGIILPLIGCRSTFRPGGRWRRYVAPLYMVPCFLFADSLLWIQSQFKPWLAGSFGRDVAIMVRSDTRELTEMFWGFCIMFTAFALYAAWERYNPPGDGNTELRVP